MTQFARSPRQSRRALWFGPTLLAMLLIVGACSSDSDSESPTETITLDSNTRGCVTHAFADASDDGEICVTRTGSEIEIVAKGLQQGSLLIVEGSDGSTVQFNVDEAETMQLTVGDQIVESSASLTATWADGVATSLTID